MFTKSNFGENIRELPEDGYGMSADRAIELTGELLDQQQANVDDRYVCCRVDGDSVYANIGRYVEHLRFEDVFNNTVEDMRREYGPYEASSSFFISIDRDNKMPTGVLRVIRSSEAGLKTLNDIDGPPLNLDIDTVMSSHNIDTIDNCWDVGTVATLRSYPSKAASIQLYRAMYLAAKQDNVDHLVSVIDSNVYRQLTGYLGIPFEPLAGTDEFEYLGSAASQAVYGYVPEFYNKMSKHMYTFRGILARKALRRLVKGTEDHTIL